MHTQINETMFFHNENFTGDVYIVAGENGSKNISMPIEDLVEFVKKHATPTRNKIYNQINTELISSPEYPASMSSEPKVEQYTMSTGMGYLSTGTKLTMLFLSDNEIENMDSIGYSGKDKAGNKTTFEEYLNSLNKGTFTVKKTKHDTGDFSEEYTVARSL